MIKIDTKRGIVNLEMRGDFAEIGADAIVILESIIEAIRENSTTDAEIIRLGMINYLNDANYFEHAVEELRNADDDVEDDFFKQILDNMEN